MDELLQHCLQELAFDGDLGCNVSRLRDFVGDFYSSRISMQNLDDSYHTFVWSLVAQHPSVRIGLLPLGQTADIYIPPQPRVSKKGKNGQDDVQKDGSTTGALDLIPNASHFPLHELVRIYGDRLRIALDSETCFEAVTGSHARPAKLTPMVYAALQIIARSRETGVSVLDIGKTTGYDQKTCFYVVKQLLDLDLIVKLRRGGNSQNFCVHKYFFDRSPVWRHVREEENRASGEAIENARDGGENGFESESFELPQFDPIDTRHLTSLTILRQRLIKLLKHSPEGIQPYTNISVKIEKGFYPRSRTDRRFFIVRLNELINEGTVEKIFVPSANPDTVHNKQIYLRLRAFGSPQPSTVVESAQKIAVDDEMLDNLIMEDENDQIQVKTTRTLHKQIIDLLQESSSIGATLNELSDRLGSYDKKTLELLISRMERQPPPPHLADLSVVQLSETHGRERRHRFFTFEGYFKLVAREGLEQPLTRYSAEDLAKAGNFMQDREGDFYETHDDLQAFYGKWSGRTHRFRISVSEGNEGSPGKTGGTSMQGDAATIRASSRKSVNPVRADGTRKRGRPPRDPDAAEKRAHKRAKNESAENIASEPKDQSTSVEAVVSTSGGPEVTKRKNEVGNIGSHVMPRRKRGRPPKTTHLDVTDQPFVGNVLELEGSSDLQRVQTTEVAGFNVQSSKHPSSSMVEAVVQPIRLRGSDKEATPFAVTPLHSPGFASSLLTSGQHRTSHAASSVTVGAPHPPSADPPALSSANGIGVLGTSSQSEVTNELREEFTRVIASLADQINESFSSGLLTDRTDENVVTSRPGHSSSTVAIVASDNNKSRNAQITEDSEYAEKIIGTTEDEEAANVHSGLQGTGYGIESPVHHLGPLEERSSNEIAFGMSGPHRERRINLAAMRRENELVQLIENAGGILNTSTTDFPTAHTNLIEAIVRAGDAASTPVGSRSDRRTLNYTLDKLEANGRIKLITTNLPSAIGGVRNAKIAYLPSISDERLRDWLSLESRVEINLPTAIKQAREEMEIDSTSPISLAKQWLFGKDAREMFQERWHRNPQRAEILFGQSDDVVCEAMLMERQTLSQLYGYLTGKVARARQLHLCTMDQFERRVESRFTQSLDERIVNLGFFENDITLETHCACVPAVALVQDIKKSFETEDGRRKPVKDVPDDWKRALQIGKAGSRNRISDLLDFLHSLRLVRPLRRIRRDGAPEIQESTIISEYFSFEELPSDWASKVPLVRPEYWQFRETAPLHLFALRTDPAPFWKDVSTACRIDAERYWAELRACSLDKGYAEKAPRDSSADLLPDGCYKAEQRVAKALRRTASWTTEYTLSWYQTQYLKRFVDYRNGTTPLQDSDDEKSRLQKISDVIHAPLDAVRRYYLLSRGTILHELKRKQQRETKAESEKKEADMKLLFARKKLEAVKSRETAWDAMVQKVYPGLLKGVAASRLRKLRQSYVGGNVVQDNHHWELQIQDAVKAAEKMRSSRNLFSNVSHANRGFVLRSQSNAVYSQLPSAAQGKSVESLVNIQGNSVIEEDEAEGSDVRKGKKVTRGKRFNSLSLLRLSSRQGGKGKGKAKPRRSRFQWNTDYDELLRDAYVILRARCRTHHRLEWATIDQIFPSVPRNSVRGRLAMLSQQPGADAYLQRLENCWHELWVKKRGTPELPDPNPRNPIDFDLKAHLQYLRKCVDKNAIRVGVSAIDENECTPLPADPNNILAEWNLEERKPAQMDWEFLSNSAMAEEVREKLFTDATFVLESEELTDEGLQPDSVCLAESALKMVIGTPDESYSANDAATLLHDIGKEDINTAVDNLLSRNIFSKLNRDPNKLVPGRTIKISEMNQNALGGPVAKDTFIDAFQLEDSYETAKDEWREWPLTSSDGDTAALLQKISDHQVEIEVDTSHAQAARSTLEGNSRKVDDDDIELCLRVKLGSMTMFENREMPLVDEENLMKNNDVTGHGKAASGDQACCSIRSDGVVDCLRCIEDSRAQLNNWAEWDRRIAESMLQLADSREKRGIPIEELKEHMDYASGAFNSVLHSLHTLRIPLLYLTGYNSTIVVSAKYTNAWTVTVPASSAPVSRILPRRWLDLNGNLVNTVWESGLRAVVGLIHLRPGISQAELRWRLRTVYDRQEVFDLLNHLLANGTLKIFFRGCWKSEQTVCIEALSKEDEKAVSWSVRQDKRWYRIS
ncbi:hypothetical protein ACEPAF_3340 [Sanghuangporus sanghuang]